MRLFPNIEYAGEWFRGSGQAINRIEKQNSAETPLNPPTSTAEVKRPEREPGSNDRDKKLDAWMEEVKAFIRNIDISKL